MESLQGKCVLLGVTGGIAAYKMAHVASALRKAQAQVHVIMTQNATRFITPLTFETLTNNRCVVDTFDRDFQYDVAHVSLAKAADLMLLAPATANVIAKLAHGLADDMLTTVALAARCKKLVAPAMNTAMLENPATQDNLKKLEEYGYEIIPPDSGLLACRDVGAGKLPEPEALCDRITRHLAREKTLKGLRVCVTAGPTQEALDPVRYLTNHSTGRMGYAVAREAMLRGADVRLISGPAALPPPPFVRMERVTTAEQMLRGVQAALPETDILIMTAAVADYRPAVVAQDKIKKGKEDLTLPLERTADILHWVSEHRHPGLFVCGFSMETRDMLEHSRAKLRRKGLDMIVANDLRQPGAGFAVDTNVVTLITPESETALPLMDKSQVAQRLLDAIEAQRNAGNAAGH
ncbi:MAG: bifunctional phosphopantothenoylcysteine decarboxylase/phosphopantothenate--cysteine ligase CoaBC [Oscillospiraceae bacterium]|nr:bifunctional phosphopantothenoylcysteine decarboxylase/phosphopantothenate--cysteine ligase CoaBC [Oscillospiraceae bacterium]